MIFGMIIAMYYLRMGGEISPPKGGIMIEDIVDIKVRGCVTITYLMREVKRIVGENWHLDISKYNTEELRKSSVIDDDEELTRVFKVPIVLDKEI